MTKIYFQILRRIGPSLLGIGLFFALDVPVVNAFSGAARTEKSDSRDNVTVYTKSGLERRMLQRSRSNSVESRDQYDDGDDTLSSMAAISESVREAGGLSQQVHTSTAGAKSVPCSGQGASNASGFGSRVWNWITGKNRNTNSIKGASGSLSGSSSDPSYKDLGLPIISRKEWGAVEPGAHSKICKEGEDGYSRNQRVMGDQGALGTTSRGTIEGVIHETQGSRNATPRDIQRMQMCDKDRMIGKPPRHFNDVAYHFLIGDDGRIYGGVPLDRLGTHTGGGNPGRIGIVFIGNNKKNPPSPEAQKSGDALVAALKIKYGQQFVVRGHHQTQLALGKHSSGCSDCMKNMGNYIAGLDRRSTLIAGGKIPDEYRGMAFVLTPESSPEQLYALINTRRSKWISRLFS